MSASTESTPDLLQVEIVLLDPDISVPAYAHLSDAGADLQSRIDLVLQPGQRALIPTGIAIALPQGHAGFVHPRSGLAAKHGITIVNAPGTVDAGYRGEILVNLLNTDSEHEFHISKGDRIAQLVIQRIEQALFTQVAELPTSVRGVGGHGSTG